MTTKFVCFCLLIFMRFSAYSQEMKGRNLVQQYYIINAFIEPQLKKAPLRITKTSQIDSLFNAIETGWKGVSADSLRIYPVHFSLSEYNNIDAYCYFWTLVSMTQNLNISSKYGDYIVNNYMAPAMQRDYYALRASPGYDRLSIIGSGNLGNTLSIGSGKNSSRETFLKAFDIYANYKALYDSLSKSSDTTISNEASTQLHDLNTYYYPYNARYAYYKGDLDKAFALLVTGLSTNKYSLSRAIALASKLIEVYNKNNDKDKSLAILNALVVNTTSDNLNRDTLKNWYANVDRANGYKLYANMQSKLSTSAFKQTQKQVRLPLAWNFISNAISPKKIKKVKYIITDFWYTACGPCIEEVPNLNKFYDKIRSRDDVIFVSVNTDYINGKMDKTYVKKKSDNLGIHYPVYYDNAKDQLAKQLSIEGYPFKVIMTKTGNVLSKTDGSDISLSSFNLFLSELK